MKPSEVWNSVNKGEITVTFSVKLVKALPLNAVECCCNAYFYGEKTAAWKNVKKFESRDEAIGLGCLPAILSERAKREELV